MTPVGVDERPHALQVRTADVRRLRAQTLTGFQVLEGYVAVQVEVAFNRVEDVENDDVVVVVAKVAQPGKNLVRFVQQVGEKQNEPSTFDPLGQFVQDRAQPGLTAWTQGFESGQERLEVRKHRARWVELPGRGVKGQQTHGIALVQHEVGQGCRQVGGVLQLADLLRGETHRSRSVDHQVGLEVGFFLELLDDKAVGARVDFPIEQADLIPGGVGSVLGELDAEPVVRTLMHPGDEALHHGPGSQGKIAQPADDFRVEELARVFDVGFGHVFVFVLKALREL